MPIVWRCATRRFDPFEPIVIFAFAYAIMFVVRPVAVILRDDARFWGVRIHPTLPLALLLAELGAVAFVCAYELRAGEAIARRLPAAPPVQTRVAARGALVVAALGVVALIVFLPFDDPVASLRMLVGGRSEALSHRIEATSTYLWNGSLLVAPATVVLVALAVRERTAKLALAAAFGLAITLVRTVPLGNRMVLAATVGGLFVLLYLMHQRRPRAAVLAVVLAVALVGSYLLGYIRDPETRPRAGAALTNLAHNPRDLFDPVLSGADAEMVEALSAALVVVPDRMPYRWGGATAGDLFARPIPRELWSGKPRPAGQEVVATLYPDLYPDLDPAFTPILPLFWDFSFVGVLVGMAFFGVLARALYEWFRSNRTALAAQLVFAVALWFVVIGLRNNPVDSIVLGAFILLPLIAIVAIAGRAAPTHAAVRPAEVPGGRASTEQGTSASRPRA